MSGEDFIPEDLADVPVATPEDEFVTDKFGRKLPRCKANKKSDGIRCGNWAFGGSDYCGAHGGKAIGARIAAGQVAHNPRGPFKEFFSPRFEQRLKELRTQKKYSIDEQLAAVAAATDWYQLNMESIEEPSNKDIDGFITLMERRAALTERLVRIESQRQFTITQQGLKDAYSAIAAAILNEVRSRKDAERALIRIKEVLTADRILVQPTDHDPPATPDSIETTALLLGDGRIPHVVDEE